MRDAGRHWGMGMSFGLWGSMEFLGERASLAHVDSKGTWWGPFLGAGLPTAIVPEIAIRLGIQRLQFVLVSRFYLGCLPELKTKCPSSLHLVQPCAYVLDMDTGACDTLELCPPFPPPAS